MEQNIVEVMDEAPIEKINITMIPVTDENLEEALQNDGVIKTEIGIEEEIEIFQNIDQRELSGMIPGIHKQGLDYDQVKDSVTLRATQALKEKIVEPSEQEIQEMRKFFEELNFAATTGNIDGLVKILEDNPAIIVMPKLDGETQVPVMIEE